MGARDFFLGVSVFSKVVGCFFIFSSILCVPVKAQISTNGLFVIVEDPFYYIRFVGLGQMIPCWEKF